MKERSLYQMGLTLLVMGLVAERIYYSNELVGAAMVANRSPEASTTVALLTDNVGLKREEGKDIGRDAAVEEKSAIGEISTVNQNSTHSIRHNMRQLSDSAKEQWCPNTTCISNSICNPCTRRYLIVIATGRSGSTTLQNMLNSLPEVRISGENNGMLNNIRDAISNTKDKKEWRVVGVNSRNGAWGHHPIPDESFACVVQQFTETINPPKPKYLVYSHDDSNTIVGFKTIRFPDKETLLWEDKPQNSSQQLEQPQLQPQNTSQQLEQQQQQRRRLSEADAKETIHRGKVDAFFVEKLKAIRRKKDPSFNAKEGRQLKRERQRLRRDGIRKRREALAAELGNPLEQAANWLKTTFPCGRFVVNIRSDTSSQEGSLKRSFDKQADAGILNRTNAGMIQFSHYLGLERALLMDFSMWSKNLTVFNHMVSWLGFSSACHFDQLFEFNTKGNYGSGKVTRRKNPPGCIFL